ncbi:hypothetical protein ACHHYP_20690 [Achlya hypogyna]|uniref:Secreted protein n=1 Tax=Achlya hypogyna TaxID=1202772 RepID=A0A1V9ZFG1_ACHHY|nr:hypothetical protein ACHHYP_20690 [Achlya hypogyna]
MTTALLSVLWSFAAPVQHTATLHRKCRLVAVDFAFHCDSGTIAIASLSRFFGLLTLVGAACIVCFALERRRVHPSPLRSTSLLLYAAAAHHFRATEWTYHGVYCLDRASALLTGLVTMQWQNTIFLFDVKTWRGYSFDLLTGG